MADKLTLEDIRGRFAEKGLELLEHEYVNSKTRMLCRTKEGYLKKISVDNLHKYKGFVLVDPRNPYTLYNLKKYCLTLNPDVELLTDTYINKEQYLQFKCHKCGTNFTKQVGTVTSYKKLNCPTCWKSPHAFTFEQVKEKFEKYGYTLVSKEYKSRDIPLVCKDKEGYFYQIYINNLGRKGWHQRFSVHSNEEFYVYNVQHFCDLNNIPVKIIRWTGEFLHKVPVLEVQCECGEIFRTTYNRLKLRYYWCPICSGRRSSYERLTEKWLKENNIKYECQYTIEGCEDKKPLFFDFYIKGTNILIEVDGDYHFMPSFFGQHYREDILDYVQRHDKIKTDFCKENDWHLIRISYLEYKSGNYVNILEQELNSQKII